MTKSRRTNFLFIWIIYLTLLLVACGSATLPTGVVPPPPPTNTVAAAPNRATALPPTATVERPPTAIPPTAPIPPANRLDPQKLPLGDGKISTTTAQKSSIFLCNLMQGGGGAFRAGEWIQGTTWDLTKKTQVSGDVKWANAKIDFTLDGNTRKVSGNGFPLHNTGVFPVAPSDKAYQYDRNPNSIRQQNVNYTFPANPTEAAKPACMQGVVGIALSGVAIFNGLDALNRDAVAHELQDKCNGHPEREGRYHYHGYSPCISGTNSGLVGYIFDGFGIYNLVENGRELTNADLDECHGHKHRIEWDGKPTEMYHYHFTQEYPYSVGCFKGTVNLPRRP
jgi:YHYH protein